MGYSTGSSKRWSEIPDHEFFSIKQESLSESEREEYRDERARRSALSQEPMAGQGMSPLVAGGWLAVSFWLLASRLSSA